MSAFWLLGWQSAVRIDGSGVTVDNFLVRQYVPWPDLVGIRAGNGLRFIVRDQADVGSLMYGGSLLGLITGDKYTRAVAVRMRAAQATLLSESESESEPGAGAGAGNAGRESSYRCYLHVPWWPLAVILAANEAVAVVALALR
ncbi:MAG TPA: PH domain-containing protein [Trebonia sp.]|nr:PH domain-containing protein [Trebonia sp.]